MVQKSRARIPPPAPLRIRFYSKKKVDFAFFRLTDTWIVPNLITNLSQKIATEYVASPFTTRFASFLGSWTKWFCQKSRQSSWPWQFCFLWLINHVVLMWVVTMLWWKECLGFSIPSTLTATIKWDGSTTLTLQSWSQTSRRYTRTSQRSICWGSRLDGRTWTALSWSPRWTRQSR